MASDTQPGMRLVHSIWFGGNPLSLALLPLAWLFSLGVRCRAGAYRRGWLSSTRIGVPVIIVGNITVGGTGKTPLVMWLVSRLREQGYRPGVVSRGYGRRGRTGVVTVTPDSDPRTAGDEPVLIAGRVNCPVAVSTDRVAAAFRLLEEGVDVIVADDGLQHYRLGRDVEVAVIDGERGLGNGRMLPAGPLREPPRRLKSVDSVIVNGGNEARMEFQLGDAIPLQGGASRSLSSFRDQHVHAIAGTGSPQRFFAALRASGLRVTEHPYPDHYRFEEHEVSFADQAPVLMTEKDGVKCRAFARDGLWQVPGQAILSETAARELDTLLHSLPSP